MAASLYSGTYRRHFRVSGGEYLGVVLCNGPANAVAPGASACADRVLIYEPDADYSALTRGVEFNVLERRQVVGTGKVLSRNKHGRTANGGHWSRRGAQLDEVQTYSLDGA